MYDAHVVAIEDQLAAGNGAGDEIGFVGNLGAMAEIDPAAIEDAAPLRLQHALVDEGSPRNPEQVPLAILDHEVRPRAGRRQIRLVRIHGLPSLQGALI